MDARGRLPLDNAQQRTLLTTTGTALWYKAGVAPVPIRWVPVRDPTGEHEPAAFLSTDLKATPAMILGWFVSRWRVETTFQEVRTHLGVETQRQWSDLAILRPPGSARPVRLDHRVGRWSGSQHRPCAAAEHRCLVLQGRTDVQRRDRRSAARALVPARFLPVAKPGETIGIPADLLSRVFQTLCLAN